MGRIDVNADHLYTVIRAAQRAQAAGGLHFGLVRQNLPPGAGFAFQADLVVRVYFPKVKHFKRFVSVVAAGNSAGFAGTGDVAHKA